jgi:hypothetical protein
VANNTVVITGPDDAKKLFRDLPGHIVRDYFPVALAAGGEVIESELALRTPRADQETTSAKEYGRLIDDLSVAVTVNAGHLSGRARIGFSDDGFVARMVEYGHAQTAHGSAGGVIGHVSAHPFMRPAADTAEPLAIEVFSDSLNSSLNQTR